MTDAEGLTEEEIRAMDKKEFRKEFPSGWMELTRVETLVLLIDVMLEAPPTREFSKTEFAEQAGLNPRSVENHVDSLVELGLIEKLDDGRDTPRYTINEDSPIKRLLDDLNITVQRVREGGLSKRVPEQDESHAAERYSNDLAREGDTGTDITPDPMAMGA